MATKKDNPGVVVPPPLIYVAIFFLSLMLQKYFPIDNSFFTTDSSKIIGFVLSTIALLFMVPALVKFAQSKNTLMTIRPANSLQTNGIYKISRNPMYTGLVFLYSSIGMLKGNWWTFILIPVIIIIVQSYVIKGEENYLQRVFSEDYTQYKKKVRRWI